MEWIFLYPNINNMKKTLKILWIGILVILVVIVLVFLFRKWKIKQSTDIFLDELQPYQERWKLNQVSWLYRISSYWQTSYWFQTIEKSDFDPYAYMRGDFEAANLWSFYASNWETTIEDNPRIKDLEKYWDDICFNLKFSEWELIDWSIVDTETKKDLWKLTDKEIWERYKVSPYYHPISKD